MNADAGDVSLTMILAQAADSLTHLIPLSSLGGGWRLSTLLLFPTQHLGHRESVSNSTRPIAPSPNNTSSSAASSILIRPSPKPGQAD